MNADHYAKGFRPGYSRDLFEILDSRPTNSLGYGDPCIYTHGNDETFALLSLYVGDILVAGRNKEVVPHLKKAPRRCFARKDMAETHL